MEEKKNSNKEFKKGKNSSIKNKNTKASTKNASKKVAPKKVANTTTDIKKKDVKVETKKTEVTKNITEEKKVTPKKARKENWFKKNLVKFANKCSNDTPFFIVLVLCVILLISLIFAIVNGNVPTTKDGEQVVASIKGKTITADDLYSSLKNNYGINVLMNDIDEYIANKEVKSDADIKEAEDYAKEAVEYYKNYAEQYGVDFETFLTDYIGINGVKTEDDFLNYVINDYKKSIAARNYIASTFSDEEIKAYYNDHYAKTMTVKHILIEVEKDEDKADAKKKAENLIKELDKVKDDTDALNKKFEELAYDNSDDSTYADGGLIEDFAKADVVEEFWNASIELEDNEYTIKPVKTEFGYHIILKVNSKEGEALKKVKDEVTKALAEEELRADSTLSVTAWDKLRNKYNLKINDKKIKKSYEEVINSYK